jgi:hypothetical protein
VLREQARLHIWRIGPGVLVLGIDSLLAVVTNVRRLGEVQAGAGKGVPGNAAVPPEQAGVGNRATVGGVPGDEQGSGGDKIRFFR